MTRSGLRFEWAESGITVDEDVGTVKLCVRFNQADNTSDSTTATITIIQNSGCSVGRSCTYCLCAVLFSW